LAAELENRQSGDTALLMQAFEVFTHASNSLESAFSQLQSQVRTLTEELEAKNLELEKSLREKQEAQDYLRKILERLPCGVIVFDQNGGITLCNPMASDVLGAHTAGSLLPETRGFFAASASADLTGKEIESEFSLNGRNRVLATSGTSLSNEEGEATGTLHIIRDVTEMKALQERNKRVERLSAMGEMAVELAHEIRNPLGSIELFASLLVKELSGDSRRWAENIRIGTRSLNTIVSNMLQFANPVQAELSKVNLHDVIGEIAKFTEPIMSQRQVGLETCLTARHPVISGDHELLKQMMLNLVFNAMKAMPSRGSLIIRTRDIGTKLELEIQDTGIGIPAEYLDRIFDPFFTTNRNGTGLGLSVVHQIVEKHSGTIRVTSEMNRGTCFVITFGREPQEGIL